MLIVNLVGAGHSLVWPFWQETPRRFKFIIDLQILRKNSNTETVALFFFNPLPPFYHKRKIVVSDWFDEFPFFLLVAFTYRLVGGIFSKCVKNAWKICTMIAIEKKGVENNGEALDGHLFINLVISEAIFLGEGPDWLEIRR